VLFRLGLAPLLLAGAVWLPGGVLVVALTLAVLSDIFDGIIARRLGCATPALRQADSTADVVFWLCMLGVAIRRAPALFVGHMPVIAALLLAEAACQALCLARFRRPVATHTYFAKSWGLVLLGCFAAMFLSPSALAIWFACLYGIAVDMEIFVILLRAASYPVDVKSWRTAVRIGA
jgi:CDP-diacylglycerol---glycerol-3-phosphate 3-phosphatidyltransferase